MVRERRNLSGDDLDKVVDGRVFTGRQAIALKLADEIGREQEAIDWLVKTSHIDRDTQVRDWRLHPSFSQFSFLHLGTSLLDGIGLGTLAHSFQEKLDLDGLLMLWHPATGN
jgi:protease-4